MTGMPAFDCALADSLIRPIDQAPVLSIVIPTWGRPQQVSFAIASVARQIDEALAGKVEVLVTDNASGPETAAVLKQLAKTYPAVSYMIHAHNEGGGFQIYAAPHRARGRWTWVFGDDDALVDNSLHAIVSVLEARGPAFLTLNRQVWNTDLDTCVSASKHDLPDTAFAAFTDLLGLVGFDQLSFLTSQIYRTDLARSVDHVPYMTSICRYSQLAYYVEAFHDQPAHYASAPVVLHRWDAAAAAVHATNFHHLATYFPELLQFAADRAGLEPGLFERIGGRRSVIGPEQKRITFVDNILENLWRCAGVGERVSADEWRVLDELSRQWRPERSEQLGVVRDIAGQVEGAFDHYENLIRQYRGLASARSSEELAMAEQLKTAIYAVQDNVNTARKAALELSANFQ
jgi:glycosyltransferase involved in cell wall biosynthesis